MSGSTSESVAIPSATGAVSPSLLASQYTGTAARDIASAPIVVYRERVRGKGGPFEGKSPNKHNRFYVEAMPLEDTVVDAIHEGTIASGQRSARCSRADARRERSGMCVRPRAQME